MAGRWTVKRGWLVSAGAAAASLAVSVALAQTVGTNTRVNQDSTVQPQNEPSIAVVPGATGPTLVAGANDYRLGLGWSACGLYRSTNGGVSWADVDGDGGGPAPAGVLPGIVTGAGGKFAAAGDPVLAAKDASNVYYVCLAFNVTPPFKSRITVSKSTDGGATWGSPVQVASGSGLLGPFPDKPGLSADLDNNNVYVAWAKFTGVVRGPIEFRRSTDGGNSFSKKITLSPFGFAVNQGASIAEDAGNVYVAFQNFNTSPHKFWLAKSTDNGQSFAPVAPIQDVNTIPSPLAGANFRVNSFPQLAVNRGTGAGSGHLYLVWADDPPGADQADIKFIKSSDGGSTWTSPVVVGDDVDNAQFFPAISVSPDGSRIDLLYYSKVNAADATFNLYYRKGTVAGDGSVSWVPALPGTLVNTGGSPINGTINFSGGFVGDYIEVDSTNSAAFAVWTDTRNGDQDIFSAPITP